MSRYVEEEEQEGMELDAREAQELEENTRSATSLDKPATITMWCEMVEEHPSGESSVEGPTKENLHKKGAIFWKAERRLKKTRFWQKTRNSLV